MSVFTARGGFGGGYPLLGKQEALWKYKLAEKRSRSNKVGRFDTVKE